MRFKIIINKWANFYFFVQNLSEWHFSTRLSYNLAWQKDYGALNKIERHALRNAKRIFRKYERARSKDKANFPIAEIFFTRRDPWIALRRRLPSEAYRRFKEVFTIFVPRFNQFWTRQNRRLLFVKKKLRISRHKLQRAERILTVFYGSSRCQIVTIYLLLVPKCSLGGGGANIGPNRITIEIGDTSREAILHAQITALHEILHACYQYSFRKEIDAFSEKPAVKKRCKCFRTTKEMKHCATVLSEMTTSAVVGNGFIDEVVFRQPVRSQLKKDLRMLDWSKHSLNSKLRKYASLELLPLLHSYYKKGRKLDEQFIHKTFQVLTLFEQKEKGVHV